MSGKNGTGKGTAPRDKAYSAKFPLLIFRDPLGFSWSGFDQELLVWVEDYVVGFDLLEEAGGGEGCACGEERMRESHAYGS